MVSLDNEGGFIKHFSYNEYLEEFQEFQIIWIRLLV